jgi:hypothetical protein
MWTVYTEGKEEKGRGRLFTGFVGRAKTIEVCSQDFPFETGSHYVTQAGLELTT